MKKPTQTKLHKSLWKDSPQDKAHPISIFNKPIFILVKHYNDYKSILVILVNCIFLFRNINCHNVDYKQTWTTTDIMYFISGATWIYLYKYVRKTSISRLYRARHILYFRIHFYDSLNIMIHWLLSLILLLFFFLFVFLAHCQLMASNHWH
jgi:hypothetical protein